VTPTREYSVCGEEEEDVTPFDVEFQQVERLSKVESEKGENKEPEDHPWHEEASPPGTYSMTCKTVAHGRNRGEK